MECLSPKPILAYFLSSPPSNCLEYWMPSLQSYQPNPVINNEWFLSNQSLFSDDPFWFNFAFNRTVTQSTTATDGKAEKAVDGIPSPGHCAKTDGTDVPYLVVDLGKEVFPTYTRLQLNREIKLEVYPQVTVRFGKSFAYTIQDIRCFFLNKFLVGVTFLNFCYRSQNFSRFLCFGILTLIL